MSQFYVSGVVDNGEECERADNEEAEFWTVYERQADGTSQALCDCSTREHAGLVAERLNELVVINNELIHAMQFAINPLLWCQRDDNIYQYRGKVWYSDILENALKKVKS